MKKALLAVFLTIYISTTSSTTYAAENQIKVDGVAITSDVKPEIKNKHTMVPYVLLVKIWEQGSNGPNQR
jgi:hypothetical protein